MAAPMPTAKKPVDLAASGGVRVSRVRRDPPPATKDKVLTRAEVREREARSVVIGIAIFTLALMILLFFATRWAGWSLDDYELVIFER